MAFLTSRREGLWCYRDIRRRDDRRGFDTDSRIEQSTAQRNIQVMLWQVNAEG